MRTLPLCWVSCIIYCYAECCYTECRYAECRYTECCYAVLLHSIYCYAECCYAKCHYAECHHAECRVSFIVMQNSIMLSVVMLSVVMLSIIMLSVIMLSVFMLRVVMLSVVLLSVVAPNKHFKLYSLCKKQKSFCFHLWSEIETKMKSNKLWKRPKAKGRQRMTVCQLLCQSVCPSVFILMVIFMQGILKVEVSLYRWPPVWLVWISLFCIWKQKLSVVIQLIPNQSNRRSMVQWYFPLQYSLIYVSVNLYLFASFLGFAFLTIIAAWWILVIVQWVVRFLT